MQILKADTSFNIHVLDLRTLTISQLGVREGCIINNRSENCVVTACHQVAFSNSAASGASVHTHIYVAIHLKIKIRWFLALIYTDQPLQI